MKMANWLVVLAMTTSLPLAAMRWFPHGVVELLQLLSHKVHDCYVSVIPAVGTILGTAVKYGWEAESPTPRVMDWSRPWNESASFVIVPVTPPRRAMVEPVHTTVVHVSLFGHLTQ